MQIKITELLNCQFIIGKMGWNEFEEKAINYCRTDENIAHFEQNIPKEKRDIDYDSFFNNKKYVFKKTSKPYAIMTNIYINSDFEKDIDCELFEEIKIRFPHMFEKEDKKQKFWSDVKNNTRYSLDFYKRYKDELGLGGIFKIYDITFDYIIENKELFDSYEGFKKILYRQQPKKIILAFSDLYIKYFKQYIEANENNKYSEEYMLMFNFFGYQWLDLEFIKILIYEHGWKFIYQWFLDHVEQYQLAAHYYGVYPLDENPDWDYILSQIPNKDDETYTIDQLKKIILNVNLDEGEPTTS